MRQSFVKAWILSGFVSFLMFAGSASAALELKFENLATQYDSDNIWITFSNGGTANPFDVTYQYIDNQTGQQTTGNVAPSVPTTDNLYQPIKLSSVIGNTFTVNNVTSAAIYISYGAEFTDLVDAPAFTVGAPSANITYQNFELTMFNVDGNQGNLTNINYFTAPLSIKSYSSSYDNGNTPLQSVGFTQSAAQIAPQLAVTTTTGTTTNTNAIVADGQIRRYLGPSTYSIGDTTNPYTKGFGTYLSSIYNGGGTQVTNTIENTNSFVTNSGDKNYEFTFTLASTILSGNSIQLTGSITTKIFTIPGGQVSTGATYDNATITISGSDMDVLNTIIYGQTCAPAELAAAVTWGEGWSNWAAFVQNPANDLTNSFPVTTPLNQLTLSMDAIGEITSAILMGFLGNEKEINGTKLSDMASYEWWQLDPLVAFSEIQSDSDNYNDWANVIYSASGNGAYSIPYSDRLGTGPLIDSVYHTVDGTQYSVDTWVVGIYDPIPEPCTAGLLLLGGAIVCWRKRRNTHA